MVKCGNCDFEIRYPGRDDLGEYLLSEKVKKEYISGGFFSDDAIKYTTYGKKITWFVCEKCVESMETRELLRIMIWLLGSIAAGVSAWILGKNNHIDTTIFIIISGIGVLISLGAIISWLKAKTNGDHQDYRNSIIKKALPQLILREDFRAKYGYWELG